MPSTIPHFYLGPSAPLQPAKTMVQVASGTSQPYAFSVSEQGDVLGMRIYSRKADWNQAITLVRADTIRRVNGVWAVEDIPFESSGSLEPVASCIESDGTMHAAFRWTQPSRIAVWTKRPGEQWGVDNPQPSLGLTGRLPTYDLSGFPVNNTYSMMAMQGSGAMLFGITASSTQTSTGLLYAHRLLPDGTRQSRMIFADSVYDYRTFRMQSGRIMVFALRLTPKNNVFDPEPTVYVAWSDDDGVTWNTSAPRMSSSAATTMFDVGWTGGDLFYVCWRASGSSSARYNVFNNANQTWRFSLGVSNPLVTTGESIDAIQVDGDMIAVGWLDRNKVPNSGTRAAQVTASGLTPIVEIAGPVSRWLDGMVRFAGGQYLASMGGGSYYNFYNGTQWTTAYQGRFGDNQYLLSSKGPTQNGKAIITVDQIASNPTRYGVFSADTSDTPVA